jgi:hypothetical protein
MGRILLVPSNWPTKPKPCLAQPWPTSWPNRLALCLVETGTPLLAVLKHPATAPPWPPVRKDTARPTLPPSACRAHPEHLLNHN